MWWRRTRSDEDFAEELHDHIARETKRLVDDEGLDFKQARARALRSFGNVTGAREKFYERRRLAWVDDLRRDMAYATRSLRRSPGFATVAILTLALGIGATTAIYSVADAILLQPLPFRNADRLVRIAENFMGRIGSGFVVAAEGSSTRWPYALAAKSMNASARIVVKRIGLGGRRIAAPL